MDLNEKKVILNAVVMEKIILGLKEIKLVSREAPIKKKAEALLSLMETETELPKVAIKDVIGNKMTEMKYKDAELHATLYILYRKLMDGKINEKEAFTRYEICVKEEERV